MLQLTKNKISSHPEFYSTLFALALPLAIQNLVTSFLNLIDNVMVGRLRETAITAVGLCC